MMGKILPLLMALVGTGAGVGAGLVLKPEGSDVKTEVAASEEEIKSKDKSDPDEKHENKAKASDKGEKTDKDAELEYVKLNNQFLVPVVVDELIDSLVVMNLSVEIKAGQGEVIYSREPKLRDALLQVLFDHANIGGFQGEFTNAKNLDALRRALTEVAQSIAGDSVNGILITDIARQDV